MKKVNLLLSVVFALSFVFTSCEKDESGEVAMNEEMEVSEDDALMTDVFDDAFNDAELAEMEEGLKSASTIVCRKVDKEWSGDTLIITISYNGECEAQIFNRTRSKSGKIIIKRFGGRKYIAGATRIITFEDYYVNNVHVEGTQTIVSQGLNQDSTEVMFSIDLVDGKLTFEDGTVVTRDAEKTRLRFFGESWIDLSDDYWMIDGTSTGVNYLGNAYTRTLSDLTALYTCRHFVSGVVEIKINDESPIILDYGEGECDDKATISKDGASREITLRHRKQWRRKL
jgi:hypothetical protein